MVPSEGRAFRAAASGAARGAIAKCMVNAMRSADSGAAPIAQAAAAPAVGAPAAGRTTVKTLPAPTVL